MARLFWFILLFTGTFTHAQSPISNPAISANALFWYRHSSLHGGNADPERNGFDVQETEVSLASDVDPYSRLFVVLSVHPEYEVSATNPNRVEQSWAIEPEEAYAETLALPSITARIGKFKAAF